MGICAKFIVPYPENVFHGLFLYPDLQVGKVSLHFGLVVTSFKALRIFSARVFVPRASSGSNIIIFGGSRTF